MKNNSTLVELAYFRTGLFRKKKGIRVILKLIILIPMLQMLLQHNIYLKAFFNELSHPVYTHDFCEQS